MHRKYNKFLIVSSIIVLVLGVYSYFYKDLQSEAAGTDSALASTLGVGAAPVVGGSTGRAADDIAFLNQLASLKNIKINNEIILSKPFKALVDNNIKIDSAPYGRVNPFSPVNGDYVSVVTPTFSLGTQAATAIANKGATLNGVLEGATSSNIYFEYGTTEKLGKATPRVSPSLAGTFSATINSLTPKTTYYFRAAANINGSVSYGEIMSFNAN